jgi:tripartite-type tricarboxylate transporter receptor subunit TctC
MTVLALTNNIRTPQLPEVPTFADLGYTASKTWYGLFAPAGTPPAPPRSSATANPRARW